MSIARFPRFERLEHGAQKEIAARMGVSPSFVSLVMHDKAAALNAEKVRKVRVAIARRLRMPVAKAFPSEAKVA